MKQIIPFVIAALVWLAIGCGAFWFFEESSVGMTLQVFAISYAMALVNLSFLTKFLARVTVLVSETQKEKSPLNGVLLALWGLGKLTALGGYIVVIYVYREHPVPLVLGGATLAFVPLVGGLFWKTDRQ